MGGCQSKTCDDVADTFGKRASAMSDRTLISNSDSSTKKCRRRIGCYSFKKLKTCKHHSETKASPTLTFVIDDDSLKKPPLTSTPVESDDEKRRFSISSNKKRLSNVKINNIQQQELLQQQKAISKLKVSSNLSLDDDTLSKIVRCFPFPPPRPSTRNTPDSSPRTAVKVTKTFNWRHGFGGQRANNERLTNNNSVKSLADDAATDSGSSGVPESGNEKKKCNEMQCLSVMVAKSVEATVPILVPWESWLRQRLSNWVQLSGHEGTIIPASEQTLWKRRAANDSNESNAYLKLMDDVCCPLVPRFYREVEKNNELFIEIEDLMRHFTSPAIMDVKLGTRTFLESEVTNPVKRKDLYTKMMDLDPFELTAEENDDQAITKLRYMQFREKESSTATLGFRIDGVKDRTVVSLNKDFKKVKTRDQVMTVLCRFLGPNSDRIRSTLIERLKIMRLKIEQSDFFRTHEVIGSSILIMYDDKHASAWMIDFAKALPVDGNIRLDHRTPWQLGNHEDGYLYGLDNFIQVLEDTKLREIPTVN